MNVPVHPISVCVGTVISRCSKNYDPGIDKTTNGTTNRIVSIGVDRGHAQTHIHNANVVEVSISRHPIEPPQHSTRCADALGVQYPQVQNVCVRCNTNVLSIW